LGNEWHNRSGNFVWVVITPVAQALLRIRKNHHMDELELIVAARQGDLDAFNSLVLAYQDVVFRQARYWVSDEETAADIAQDTFIKAFLSLKDFQGGSFRAWLLRTATHASIDELRRRQRRPTLSIDAEDDNGMDQEVAGWMADPQPLPEEIAENKQLQQAVQAILEDVKPVYRAAVVLVDLQGLDYEEASQALGVPVGTLKSRLARGRMMVRTLIENSRSDLQTIGSGMDVGDGWGKMPAPLR
jgi:RNA polymerase sigma-70 factor (ECF subfamily)